nr:histone H1 [Bacteroides eggerthii]
MQRKFAVFQKDVEQLVSKGNNVAGMKAHKATLELRSLLKEFRKMSVEVAK